MLKTSLALLAILVLFLGVPGAAQADRGEDSAPSRADPEKPSSDPSAREKAKALFEEANAHYKVREFEKALQGFKEAYLLSEEPVLLFNMAQCYRQLDRQEEALKTYQAFLLEDPNSPLRANAEARIKELKAHMLRSAQKGSLQISSQQDPAEIYLDGEFQGTTPLKISDVVPGEHRLAVKKKGFVDYDLSITIEPGQPFVLEVPLLEEAVRPPFLMRLLLPGAGAAGAAALATGGVAISSALKVRSLKQEDGSFLPGAGIESRRAIRLALISDALLGAAALGVGTWYLMKRRFDKKIEVAATPLPGGMAFTVEFAHVP